MNTKYDWSKVPSKVLWIATDADGSVCGYSSKPQQFSLGWNTQYSGNFIAHSLTKPFSGYWRNSLEERPK